LTDAKHRLDHQPRNHVYECLHPRLKNNKKEKKTSDLFERKHIISLSDSFHLIVSLERVIFHLWLFIFCFCVSFFLFLFWLCVVGAEAPQCCPTRNSLMTGLRPDRTRVFTNGDLHPPAPASALHTNFREAMPDGATVLTIPQYFRQHGYYTTGQSRQKSSHLISRICASKKKKIHPPLVYVL
jgi:hypothetical protein